MNKQILIVATISIFLGAHSYLTAMDESDKKIKAACEKLRDYAFDTSPDYYLRNKARNLFNIAKGLLEVGQVVPAEVKKGQHVQEVAFFLTRYEQFQEKLKRDDRLWAYIGQEKDKARERTKRAKEEAEIPDFTHKFKQSRLNLAQEGADLNPDMSDGVQDTAAGSSDSEENEERAGLLIATW